MKKLFHIEDWALLILPIVCLWFASIGLGQSKMQQYDCQNVGSQNCTCINQTGGVTPASPVQTNGQLNASQGDNEQQSSGEIWIILQGLSGCAVAVFTFFLMMNARETRELMDGQLKATQTAANAALAGLDRPWLVIEGFKLNEKDWLDCKNPLIAEFEIANHGKAPALIKRIVVCHFRGPHHHNGYPSSKLPDGVLRFPEKDDFVGFLNRHGRAVMQEVKASSEPTAINPDNPQERGFLNLTLDHSFVISGGDRSETFCAWGQAPLTVFVTEMPIVQTTENYLIGSVYYEFPGNQAELMRFCYKANGRGSFDLYRDYAPYNETKNAKPQ